MNKQSPIYRMKLFIVFNQALSKLRKSNIENKDMLLKRLYRAMGILQSPAMMKEDHQRYEPTKWSCGCEDYIYRISKVKRGYCKHMMSVILLERMNALQYRQLDFFSKC